MASFRRISPPTIMSKPRKLNSNIFFIWGKSHHSITNSTQLVTAAIWYSGLWLSRNESVDNLSGLYFATMTYSEKWKNERDTKYQPKYFHFVSPKLKRSAIPKTLPNSNRENIIICMCHWPDMRSRWLEIGHIPFLFVYYRSRWRQSWGPWNCKKSIQPISIPAILAKQAWSTKELLCGFQRSFLAGRSREPWVGKIAPISAEKPYYTVYFLSNLSNQKSIFLSLNSSLVKEKSEMRINRPNSILWWKCSTTIHVPYIIIWTHLSMSKSQANHEISCYQVSTFNK